MSPNDNLYKFMAVLGLALIIASGWFGQSSLQSIGTQRQQLGEEVAVLTVEIKQLDRQRESLTKSVSKSQADLKVRASTPGADAKAVAAESQKIDTSNDQIFSLGQEIEIKRVRLDAKGSTLLELLGDLSADARWCGLGLIVGALLMLFGLFRWYYKQQVYYDLQLKNKTMKAGQPPD